MSSGQVHPVVDAVTAAIGGRSRVVRERHLARVRRRRPADAPVVAVLPGATAAHPEVRGALGVAVQAVRAAGAVVETPSRVPVPARQGGDDVVSHLVDDPVSLATTAALSRTLADGAVLLDTGEPVTRSLLLGAASAGHLPTIAVPVGPPGNGPALLEVMGLQLPGGGSVAAAAVRLVALARPGPDHLPLAVLLDERVIVNGLVAVLATGQSPLLVGWLRRLAAAVAVDVRRSDVDRLHRAVPRRAPADGPDRPVDATAMLVQDLLEKGLVHGGVRTVAGTTLHGYGAARRAAGIARRRPA